MKAMLRWLTLAALVVLLTGCVSAQVKVKVNPDGSADQENIFALDRTVYGMVAGDGQDPVADARTSLEKQGFTVSKYEKDNWLGIRGQKHVDNLSYITWDDNTWKGRFDVTPSVFWKDYTLNLDALLDSPDLKDPQVAPFIGQMDIRVTLELPVTVKQHNGQADSTGKVVTWALVPGTKEHMTLSARQYLWGRIGFAAGVLVVILVALVLLVIRKRPAAQPVLAQASGDQFPPNVQ